MGRTVTINGKNVENRGNGGARKSFRKKSSQQREKKIQPYKMPNTIFDGYAYHRRGKYTTVTGEVKAYLRCKFSTTGCPGKGELDEAGIFILTHPHTPTCKDPFALQKTEFRQELFEAVQSTPKGLKEVYNAVANEQPIGAQFCPYPSVKTALTNWRNQNQPPMPNDISEIATCLASEVWARELTYDIDFANELTGTIDRSTHIIQSWQVEVVTKRIQAGGEEEILEEECHVVIGTPTFAEELADIEIMFVDCTFDSVPNVKGCYQFLTVMVEYMGKAFPVAWALMSRKTETAYTSILQCIASHVIPAIKPQRIVTDFEAALQTSLAKIYPEATLQGCFFHYCHALLKRRQKSATITRVKRNCPHFLNDAHNFLRNTMNLALLPAEVISEAFEDLVTSLAETPALHSIMEDFVSYFRRYWLDAKGPNTFSVFKQQHRTNNVLERYHRTLKFGSATRPEIYKFICVLKDVQECAHADLLIARHGLDPHRMDAKSKRRERTITVAWERMGDVRSYEKNERQQKIRNFLRAVAPFTANGPREGRQDNELVDGNEDINIFEQIIEEDESTA